MAQELNQGDRQENLKVSVLMSLYHKESPLYFRVALESILSQTILPDEIVIIIDGPISKELESVVAWISQQYDNTKVFRFEENVQLGLALRKGVELCSYSLVARMDTDDIMRDDRIQKQVMYMDKHPEVSVCGSEIAEFSDENHMAYKVKHMPEDNVAICKYAKKRNPVNHMSVMFRREAVLRAGNYEHCPGLEDYHLWTRMIVQGERFYNIQEPLIYARTGDGVYRRRGGRQYTANYIRFRKWQRKVGFLSVKEWWMAVCLTFGMTATPNWIRKLLYQKVLRK